ncbi:hydrolase CocE/NonD family protein [Variovorax sp. PBL-E5]|nr:hydrolase CocE/NonD family protein [Variovorax sp. PBL-E5]
MNRRLRPFGVLLASLASLVFCGAVAAHPAQAVSFDGRDGLRLSGWLMLPATPPQGTVIALHGCGGLYATAGSRKGELNARHQAMGDMLVDQGYAVLFPDSFTSRGVHEICTQRIGARALGQTERRRDVLASLDWVAAQPWADARKVALLGWSHGGSAVLAATDATRRDVMAEPLRFATAIAFYPGCSAALTSGYRPDTRLTVMIGADVPNGVHPGQGVHAGANPAARAQAYERVRALLRQAFDRPHV